MKTTLFLTSCFFFTVTYMILLIHPYPLQKQIKCGNYLVSLYSSRSLVLNPLLYFLPIPIEQNVNTNFFPYLIFLSKLNQFCERVFKIFLRPFLYVAIANGSFGRQLLPTFYVKLALISFVASRKMFYKSLDRLWTPPPIVYYKYKVLDVFRFTWMSFTQTWMLKLGTLDSTFPVYSHIFIFVWWLMEPPSWKTFVCPIFVSLSFSFLLCVIFLSLFI